VNLDRDFQSIVADRVGQASREALLDQHNCANLPERAKKRITRELTNAVIGEQFDECCGAA
jgi:hypothetical protein